MNIICIYYNYFIILFINIIIIHRRGAYYPVGGSSQISANIIQQLEKRGSKVLVRADVTKIVLDETGKTAIGVEVTKANKKILIKAPLIISSVGAYNTYVHLLNNTIYSSLTPPTLSNAISFCTIFIGYKYIYYLFIFY